MSAIHSQPPVIIDTPGALTHLVDELRLAQQVAIDTESNSLYAYREQVCLIQISTRTNDYLIDPLALGDLSPLGALTAAPTVEKVFHAAEYDLISLRRDFGFEFAALFDTYVAARVLGWEQVGLASILKMEFDVRVNKRYQRADWGARPLSQDMVRYAQQDTHYLLPLRDRLHAELTHAGRMEEAREAFSELLKVEGRVPTFDPDAFWNLNGTRDMRPHERAVLRELYLYRDRMAKGRDCPPFKVMNDETLLDLARRRPTSLDELKRLGCMSDRQVRRYGRGVLQCVRQGLQAEAPQPPPRSRRPDETLLARFEALRTWRKERARSRGVESDVIISKDVLWRLAKVAPRTLEQLAGVRDLGPWKRKTYGEEILQVIIAFDEEAH